MNKFTVPPCLVILRADDDNNGPSEPCTMLTTITTLRPPVLPPLCLRYQEDYPSRPCEPALTLVLVLVLVLAAVVVVVVLNLQGIG
jgi:hypothetical protein